MKSSSFCTERYSTSYVLSSTAVGAQQFHFLFTLSAVLSEQGPLLQGRRTQRVPSDGGSLPSMEGNGLPLSWRQTPVRICCSLCSGEAVNSVCTS